MPTEEEEERGAECSRRRGCFSLSLSHTHTNAQRVQKTHMGGMEIPNADVFVHTEELIELRERARCEFLRAIIA